MGIGTEGYKIERYDGLITVYGESEVGVLYGVFGVLRLMRLGGLRDGYQGIEIPDNPLRMLNHWDNMDGSIERGYSGESFFFKNDEVIVSERIVDYARLNASVGINGVVINNVNVAGAAIDLITEKYREPLKTYSDIFRAHGIKLYLSLDYAAPMDIGGLDTCDPLDEQVITYINQYFPKNKRMYSSTVTCPESLLLFFHRIPYTYQLSTGKTLIQHIYDAHYEGVDAVSEMMEQWTALEGTVEALPYMRVKERLEHQLDHAGLWRDVVNSYFYRKTLIEDEKGRKLY